MPKKENVYSGRQLAKKFGFSETTVRNAHKKGHLVRIKSGAYKGKYDITDPINVSGLQIIKASPQSGDKRPRFVDTKPKIAQKTKPKKETKKGLELKDIDHNDFNALRSLKEREAIREKQLKNEKFRGELVNRKAVSQIFNKLWSVDSSQLIPLATKISPEICSICGVEDPEVIAKVREKIDKEVWNVLGHCKRIMSDYLSKIEAGEINDNNI